MTEEKDLVTLIDLGSIYWAAWHATADSSVSEAIRSAVGSVQRYAENQKLVAVCCDSPKSWRKEIEPTYKANRPEKDARAVDQLRETKEQLRKAGFLLWEGEGFEADDVIATGVKLARAAGHPVRIVSADKDLTQLVHRSDVVWESPKTNEVLDAFGVRDKFGVMPDKMGEWLALVGDSSDNIAGVPGLGKVGAPKLLAEYGSIANMLREIEQGVVVGKPAVSAAIHESQSKIALALMLVRLKDNVPIRFEDIYERRQPEPDDEPLDFSDLEGEGDDFELEPVAPDPAAPNADPFDAIGEDATPAPAAEQKPETPAPAAQPANQTEPVFDAEFVTAPQAAPAKAKPQNGERSIVQVVPPPSWDLALEPRTINDAYKFAIGVFKSGIYTKFPNPEAVWAIIIRGREMGLSALAALDNFHIVEGKPCPHAHLLIARIKAHPHCEYLQFLGGDHTFAEYEIKNRRSPKPVPLRYTIEEAEKAGLLKIKPGKEPGNWHKRPAEMLRKTCAVQLGRIEFPDATQGLYAVEELGGETWDAAA